jgi:O-antigen ligase
LNRTAAIKPCDDANGSIATINRTPNRTRRLSPFLRISPSFALLIALMFLTLIAGGASHGDQLGQVVVRAGAWLALILAVLFNRRPAFEQLGPVAILLLAIVALPLIQLIPWPPTLWQQLPGREIFVSNNIKFPQGLPWRPISMLPDGTLNSLSSLIVPVAVLALIEGFRANEFALLPRLLIGLTIAELAVGLAQLSGNAFAQPLINYVGDVSGTFANRNHFALSLAFLVLFIPSSVVSDERAFSWRLAGGMALGVLTVLVTLGSGSRSGVLIVLLALLAGTLAAREGITRLFLKTSRIHAIILFTVALILLICVIIIYIFSGRAESITRFDSVVNNEDIRFQGYQTVIAMIYKYFPIGTGFGSFSTVYRIDEPYYLLRTTYFNHAHNDILEVILDGGLAAIIVLSAAFFWWLAASRRVWFARPDPAIVNGRLGSAIILLTVLASTIDYPARTPLMMAIIVVAAGWLSAGSKRSADDRVRPRSLSLFPPFKTFLR